MQLGPYPECICHQGRMVNLLLPMQTQQLLTGPSITQEGAELFTLKADQIGDYWPTIVSFLLMVHNRDWLLDQVLTALTEAKAQLWGIARNGIIKGVWITRIDETASARFGFVWIAAGEGLDAGVPLFLDCTEQWFREKECEYIEIVGRRGWGRVLPGYHERAVIFRKDL